MVCSKGWRATGSFQEWYLNGKHLKKETQKEKKIKGQWKNKEEKKKKKGREAKEIIHDDVTVKWDA